MEYRVRVQQNRQNRHHGFNNAPHCLIALSLEPGRFSPGRLPSCMLTIDVDISAPLLYI
jgi:hypothetical protein